MKRIVLTKYFFTPIVVALLFGLILSNINTAYAITGIPGSTKTNYNSDGSVKQERTYGSDGRAEKDVDYNHGGTGHTFPHEHTWDWSKTPPRQPGVPITPAPCPTPSPGQGSDTNTSETDSNNSRSNSTEVIENAVVGVTVGTILYFIISEGLRIVVPIRNLIPVP